LTDVETLRARAHIDQGPITSADGADRERVIQVLNEALATELVCILRYKRHYYTATGLNSARVAAEFLQHATEEQQHADQLALRITQPQGEPDFNPDDLASRAHAEYDASLNLLDMVREGPRRRTGRDRELQRDDRLARSNDPTTRRILEDILAVEEHADDLLSILEEIGNRACGSFGMLDQYSYGASASLALLAHQLPRRGPTSLW
jgi:bacterioferritin